MMWMTLVLMQDKRTLKMVAGENDSSLEGVEVDIGHQEKGNVGVDSKEKGSM